jgi:predicted cupin superfamily sugar epimerase
MEKHANYYIKNLNLLQHPEGGYFKEIYRSDEKISADSLPERYNSERNFGTLIYYLLEGNQKSNFHILNSDEAWHHIDGCGIIIHCINKLGEYTKVKVGTNLQIGELPQIIIPKMTWFAAELAVKESYSLVGCSVFPGFEFADFELAIRDQMIKKFPDHESLITEFTKK